jgi:hypothetical protein
LNGAALNSTRKIDWVYFLPALHLSAFALANIGYLVPTFQYLGIIDGYILVADLPVSLVTFALAWRYPGLAAVWIVVAGTLWWYLIARLLKFGVQKLLRKGKDSYTIETLMRKSRVLPRRVSASHTCIER